MPTTVDHRSHDQIERRLADVDLDQYIAARQAAGQRPAYQPSPASWEDQVLYFLMLDRFSDGRELGTIDNDGRASHGANGGGTPAFKFPQDVGSASRPGWLAAGGKFCGGNLAGLESKLGYLRRLGVTAVWVSPVLKQVAFEQSYHGYGTQNFLDVDPHFGTRQDLRDLVTEAHRLGIYVILDIIINHTGDVFDYRPDRPWFPKWDGREYPLAGFRDRTGQPSLPIDLNGAAQAAWPDGAIWPAELQDPASFTRRGQIDNWDHDPEFLEGDFFSLKDVDHGSHVRGPDGGRLIDQFQATPALEHMCKIFKFWMAYADVDGYRIDTVKHLEIGATRHLVRELKEFAACIGKENFFLLGEITGGRKRAFDTLGQTGLDAALGIDDVGDKLEFLAKGLRNPQDYFGLFRNSALLNKGSQLWIGQHVVTMFDDHDKVGRAKVRFCGDAGNDPARKQDNVKALRLAFALNLLSMGIPCIYYGSEQAFDGGGEDTDRLLRESMFGGPFGAQQSKDRHFFDESRPVFQEAAALAKLRRELLPLRRGRQYLREISDGGAPGSFGPPVMIGNQIRALVPWSRIFNREEVLVAINTDLHGTRRAWVTVDSGIHPPGSKLRCRLSTDPAQVGQLLTVEGRNGSAVNLTVPAAGYAIYA